MSAAPFIISSAASVISVGLLLILTWKKKERPLKHEASPPVIAASKLTIHSARYGSEAHNYQPVSEEMLRRHDGGAIAVLVSNNLVPFDPSPNIPKHLEVEYSYGHGEQYHRHFASSPEGHLLILPEDRARLDAAQSDLIKAHSARAQAESRIDKLEKDLNQALKDLDGSERDSAAHKKRADELQAEINAIRNSFRTDAPSLIVKYGYDNGRQMLTFVNDSIFAATTAEFNPPFVIATESNGGVFKHEITTIPATIPVIGNRASDRCELITKDIKQNCVTNLTDIIRREPPGTVDTVTLNYSNSIGVEFSRVFTLRRHADDTVEWKPGPIRLRGSNAVS